VLLLLLQQSNKSLTHIATAATRINHLVFCSRILSLIRLFLFFK